MNSETDDRRCRTEEFRLDGSELLDKIKELIHQGNIRRITIKNESGQTLLEIPLTLGVVGAALLPVLAAVGALAALVTRCSIVVEKIGEPPAV
ncbi:MAG TPA: DUF4342 domain-containing protein [Acidobacteriota bacterium]|nr:DUF4342 domain-containing protein [Acidobacteriota bacterium]HNU00942.1 DUF4342 domain-containing protein [Acidobacteriota bacterium]HPB29441.1 DUF4342 domain-containing protein [Acidobacteriota bacterium]HQO25966.1 DUF4342 domain-containing protein [Acidobacteriota bacterium]HQP74693.1 DUF4342 domain-containing protein [Acidobacteriota bacterium]